MTSRALRRPGFLYTEGVESFSSQRSIYDESAKRRRQQSHVTNWEQVPPRGSYGLGTSQSFTDPSRPADATSLPSGEKVTAWIGPHQWRLYLTSRRPVPTSQRRSSPFFPG